MTIAAGSGNNSNHSINSSNSYNDDGDGVVSQRNKKQYQQHQNDHPVTSSETATSSIASSSSSLSASTSSSSTPVIGILTQPLNDEYDYIAASYVKWIEVGGARSIAIPFDAYNNNNNMSSTDTDSDYLDDLVTQIHGILLPGGGSMIAGPPPPTVQYLLNKVLAMNQAGHYFPVWGTCLGFEYLIRHVANCTILPAAVAAAAIGNNNKTCPMQAGFDAENISLPLQHVVPWHLYQDDDIRQIVTTQNVTMNNHQLGMTVDDFYNYNDQDSTLSQVWKVTSINHDRRGRPFVSTIEPVDPDQFPLYGTQYHAEKNAFEYATYPNTDIAYEDINHSADAIRFSIYTATFFVQQLARRSLVANPSHVYNQTLRFPPVYTYPIRAGEAFEQIHVIPKKTTSTSTSTTVNGNNRRR
jgi:gamma-glutamyl hydrolase